jgi:hypothetical protein
MSKREMREEETKRKLVLLMAKGEIKAAMRIQYHWWRFRAWKQGRDKEAAQVRKLAPNPRTPPDAAGRARASRAGEGQRRSRVRVRFSTTASCLRPLTCAAAEPARVGAARVAQKEMVASVDKQLRAKEDLNRREDFVMAQPVFKKARSMPLGFQKKQMQLDAGRGELTYWKFLESIKATVKSIKLEPVTAIEQRNSATVFLLVLAVQASGAARAKSYTFRMASREASDVWLKHLRQACRNGRVIVTPAAAV